ncbi:MAG: hypothetical protein K2W85_05675 [Phycisphaerales bacterium]|nr:hypothetical protein [Phycisphaerales bacterium]
MSAIPANLSRVPNLLASQLLLAGVNRSNVDLLTVQQQMASGKRVNRYSEDPIAGAAIGAILQRFQTGQQTLNNLGNAQNNLDLLDTTIGEATDLVREAKSIASSQIGVTSDRATRTNQATVIDGMLRSLFQLANRQTNGLYLFGGDTATTPPIVEARNGYRYVGRGSGLRAELGSASDVPITIGGDNAIGETSARLKGLVDLNPALTPATRLTDLVGARGLGIAKNTIQFAFNGGPAATVDFSGADTVGDVVTRLESAIRQYETDNGVSILGPGGVAISGGGIRIDVVGGSPNPNLTFSDIGSGSSAADLGLSATPFNAASTTGSDTNPRLSLLTPLSAVSGLTVPLATIRFRFGSAAGSSISEIDLSSAQTVDDIRNLIETQVPGVRVRVNAAGTGIDLFNEISGPSLSIEPTGIGPDTATELGIRSQSAQTRTSDYNDGRGVRIINNAVDPVSGSAIRSVNTDFRITLGNGQAFDVDLRPQDLVDTQSVIDRINSEFAAAVGQPPINASAPPLALGQFSAALPTNGNGLALTQTLGGTPQPIRVEALNNSLAAEDLGFAQGTYVAGSATFTAQDRAGIRVNNIFTALVQLRDALLNDSSTGITVAGGGLDQQVDRLAQVQALVGVYANRVKGATERQEDEQTVNEQIRSQLQDVDYADAAIRFNQLRTQLQAALQTGSQAQNLTLLDFLR